MTALLALLGLIKMGGVKLSICILTYNRRSLLDECLGSFVYQIIESSLQDGVEIVVSDNCSTDDTQMIVKKYQELCGNIIYNRNKSNLGFEGNVEKAFNLASGEYIWLFGDDDWVRDDAVEKIYGIVTTQNIGAMIVNWKSYFPNGLVTEKTLKYENDQMFHSISELLENVNSTFYLSSLIFKKCMVEKEDIEKYFHQSDYFYYGLFLNAAAHSSRCAVIAEPIVCHRYGSEGYLRQWPEIFLNYMPEFLIQRSTELNISSNAIDYQLKEHLTKTAFLTILRVRSIFNRSFFELWPVLRKSYAYFNSYPGYYIFILPAFFIPLPVLHVSLRFCRLFRKSN
jgi:glycosyltransferase involved in cell wall biosynthesis